MGWEIISEKIEIIEYKNLDIYVKRAEYQLSKGDIQSAIEEIDTAITYCEPNKKHHYIYEKAKVLFAANNNTDCVILMRHHLKDFYDNFDSIKFSKSLELLIKSGNYSFNDIKNVLSEKNISRVTLNRIDKTVLKL